MRFRRLGENLEVTLYLKKINKKVKYVAKDSQEAFEIANELLK